MLAWAVQEQHETGLKSPLERVGGRDLVLESHLERREGGWAADGSVSKVPSNLPRLRA
jgi:hypothetical protein